MRAGSLFFLLGIVVFAQLPAVPPAGIYLLSPLCLFLCGSNPCFRLCAWCLSGFLWACCCAEITLSDRLPLELEGVELKVMGKVVSLPVSDGKKTRFEFRVGKLTDEDGREWESPGKIRLSWYKGVPSLVPGQVWQLTVKLKRPYGFMNPGGFDYEGWLFQKKIRATGYVVNPAGAVLLKEAEGEYLHRMRAHLRTRIINIFEDATSARLLIALIVGERSGLTANQWRVLTVTGTNHLMAISGLHIGLVAGLVFLLVRYLWPLGVRTALILAAPKMAVLCAIISAAFYAGLAGFAVPTQRALIMLVVFLGLKLLHRQTSAGHIIAAALFLILVIDPFAVLAPGFWLSFSALIVIVFGMSSRLGVSGLWWRWGRVQFLVATGLIPVLVFWFQQIPLPGIAANTIAVPWVSVFTVPLALLGTILLTVSESAGVFILHLALVSLDIIWRLLRELAAPEFNIIPVQQVSGYGLVFAVIGVTLLLMPRGLPGRYLGFMCLLPMFFPYIDKPARGELHFTVLDVGQGLAVVVQTHNHTLVYDTGPEYGSRFNAGSAVIGPYLRYLGIYRLDRLVISHGDNDHIGGMSGLLETVEVDTLFGSRSFSYQGRRAIPCNDTQSWRWDGVEFAMLHPAMGSGLSGNDRSCVLRIKTAGRVLLLTGDIEKQAEQMLIDKYGSQLKADIIIAPHHGSRTSSTDGFIDAAMPEYVIFPVGYRNRFGFPKKDIIQRYEKRGVRQLETARSGAIEFRITDLGVSFTEYRQSSRRFWHTEY